MLVTAKLYRCCISHSIQPHFHLQHIYSNLLLTCNNLQLYSQSTLFSTDITSDEPEPPLDEDNCLINLEGLQHVNNNKRKSKQNKIDCKSSEIWFDNQPVHLLEQFVSGWGKGGQSAYFLVINFDY